ncbi:MAG TPA: SDR family NAD(P)-dependent oxidoreductase [Solirubrobacteraceae bacterium]|nr:SDR family NAD(P)-dependent oxidoreductase [Solirubrobacteraceae bacterium]
MQPDLTGQTAVVTGAGSGIGRATAILLARHGASLYLADLNLESAQEVARVVDAAGGRANAYELDVSDPAAVDAFAQRVFDEAGGVDILHNNAGIGHAGNVEATTIEDWQRVIGVNLLGVAYGVQAFVPRMLEQRRPASVINTASMAGIVPTAKMTPYVASKFGVVGMTEALNAELSGRGIHVSAICPGIINTPIVAKGTMRGDMAQLQDQATRFYAKRGTSPDEVAKAVLRTIVHPRLIVPVPRRQVTLPYLLHRISPRLAQPIARSVERVISRG